MAPQHIVKCTASGEQHGLINTLSNSVVFDDFKHMSPEMKLKCEKQKKDESRIIKVRYWNTRGRHERLTKPYCRWAGDPIQQWHFIPDQEYEIPFGLFKEVNEEQGEVKKRAGLLSVDGSDINRDGSPLDKDQKGERLHMFIPVEYKFSSM